MAITFEEFDRLTDEELDAMSDAELRELKKRLKEEEEGEDENIKNLKKEVEVDPEIKRLKEDLKKAKNALNPKIEGSLANIRQKEISEMKRALRKMDPESFVYLIANPLSRPIGSGSKWKEKFLYNPDFMRHISAAQYEALMKSKALDDKDKEKATEAYLRFVKDFIENPKMIAYKKARKQYEEDEKVWLKKISGGDPEAKPPIPDDPTALPPAEPTPPADSAVRRRFRNDIRDIDILIYVDRYMPEVFEEHEIVKHIRFEMIGNMRKHKNFSDRGTEIRSTKFEHFSRIVEGQDQEGDWDKAEKYFDTYSDAALDALRGRMSATFPDQAESEIAGSGSAIWKTGTILDLASRNVLAAWKGKDTDLGDKEILVRHMLVAEWLAQNGRIGTLTPEMRDSLDFLRGQKEGSDFYNIKKLETQLKKRHPEWNRPRKPYLESTNKNYFRETKEGGTPIPETTPSETIK